MEETESSESGGLAYTLRAPAAALFPEPIPGVPTSLLPGEGTDMSAAIGMHCVCFLAWPHSYS